MEQFWQQAEQIAAKIEQSNSDYDKEYNTWLSDAVDRAKENMMNSIIELDNSEDSYAFEKEVNESINSLKEQAIKNTNSEPIKKILMLTQVTTDQLDDYFDTWITDFSWDYDLGNQIDREEVLWKLMSMDLSNSSSFYDRVQQWTDIMDKYIKTGGKSRVDQINSQIKEAMWK